MTEARQKPGHANRFEVVATGATFAPGDRVQFSSRHLRNTCQHTGPDAPCDVGPWARGEIVGAHPEMGDRFVVVKWDNGVTRTAAASNLWPVGKPEPA